MIAGNMTNLISSLVNFDSSVFSRFVCANNIFSAVQKVMNFLYGLFYTIAKYLLYLVDLIFSYIQKLAGLDMAMDSLESMISPDSDIVFNLLISGSDLVTAIIRNLIVLAIVMIIVFAIIAIIKGQYDAMKKNSQASPFETLKTMLKAFLLLLVTPLFTIGGIIVSDLLLQTLYRATNVSGAMSLGTQVFVSASSSANAYRLYAQNGGRIPITFDGTKSSEINAYFNDHSVSDGFVKYLQDSKNSGNETNPIYATYMTFLSSDFTPYISMNDILSSSDEVKNTKELYDTYGESLIYPDLMKIQSYAEQYYVMADVIDFCVKSGSELYMRTIEQVLRSVCNLKDDFADKEKIFSTLVNQYEIKFFNGYDTETSQPINEVLIRTTNDYLMNIRRGSLISFNSNYYAPDDSGDPTVRMQIRVIHVVGETDELRGAKFIMTSKNEVQTADGISQRYFMPLVNGYVGNYGTEFRSDYIRDGSIVVAKGVFSNSKYPTAIKVISGDIDKPIIAFYREDIDAQATGQLGDYFSLKVDAPKGGFLGKLIKMIKALFDPSELIPEINVNFDALQITYDKSNGPTEVDTLIDGRIRLGYFMKFNPTYPTTDLVTNFCLSYTELYSAPKMNYLLLVVGSFLLVKVCLSAITSLIERAYELFLIFITYPAACATIPIDNGGAYGTWLKGYFERIFRAYGFILGINFVLMLFPIIQNIAFFSQDDIGTSKIVRRVGVLFFNVMTVRQITESLNFFIAIICELIAFTLIETIPETVSTIIGGKDAALNIKDNNVFKKLTEKAGKVTSTVGKVVVPPLKTLEYVGLSMSRSQKAKQKKKQMRDQLRSKVMTSVGLDVFSSPLTEKYKDENGVERRRFTQQAKSQWGLGSKIKEEAKRKHDFKKAKAEQDEANENLFKVLNDPLSTKAQVTDALAHYEAMATKTSSTTRNKGLKCNQCHRSFTIDKLMAEDNKRKTIIEKDSEGKEVKKNNPNYFKDTLKQRGGWLCPDCFMPGMDPGSAPKLEPVDKKDKGSESK